MAKRKIKIMNSETGYNLAADFYDQKEKHLNSFEQNKLMTLMGENIKDIKILDIGAGTGRLSLMMAKRGAEVTALDVSEKMLEKIKQKCRGMIYHAPTLVIGDAENLPFDNETFDIVTAAFLIVHLKDLKRFFDEVYRVLKDGGLFVVTNINQKDPPLVKTKEGEIIIESYYHRPEKVREVLESLAFGIEKEEFVREGGTWVNQILVCRK